MSKTRTSRTQIQKLFKKKKKTQTQNFEQIKLKFSNFSQHSHESKQKFLNPNFSFSTNLPKLKLSTQKKKKIDIGKHPARLKPSKKPVYLYNNIEEEEDNRFLYIYFFDLKPLLLDLRWCIWM